MGIDTRIWGPHGWIFLHLVTLNYPNKPTITQKKNYKNFFESIQHILPCDLCKNHYTQNLNKYKLNNKALSCRKELTKWLVDIHNEVNDINKSQVYTYDQAENQLRRIVRNNPMCSRFKVSKTLIIVTIFVLLFAFIKNYFKKI